MKRDLDLIRKLLFYFEERLPEETIFSGSIELEGYSTDQISYHISLLDDAGYIVVGNASSFRAKQYMIERLTWEGCEFIDAARNDNNWNKAKKVVAQAGGLAFELLKQILLDYAKQNIANIGSNQ